MRFRDNVLEVRKDMGTSGTLTFNLDYADPISQIDLLFEATNGATYNKASPLETCVSKIEVVDGSDVLYSLPGDVAFGTYCHLANRLPKMHRTENASDTPYVVIPIMFGRYLYDQVYAFNPVAHRNPQLKVTFNEATVNAAGNTGFVSDSWNLSIVTRLMEDAAAPRAFLMQKEIETFTSLASGDHVVEMPTDYPYRALIVRAYEANIDCRSSLTGYKLSCDGGKFIPIDYHSRYLEGIMFTHFKQLEVGSVIMASNASNSQHWVGYSYKGAGNAVAQGYIFGASTWGSGRVSSYLTQHDGTAANNVGVTILVNGLAFQNCMIIPFGRLDYPEEWFVAPGYGNVKLYLTQGNAGAEVNVCLQQARLY
jgi:hypothetical protein